MSWHNFCWYGARTAGILVVVGAGAENLDTPMTARLTITHSVGPSILNVVGIPHVRFSDDWAALPFLYRNWGRSEVNGSGWHI